MTRQTVLFVILVICLILAAVTYWPKKAAFKAGPKPMPEMALVSEEAQKKITELQVTPLTVEAKALADPFAQRVAARKKVEEQHGPPSTIKILEPKLEGIWVDSGMRIAFISGQSLSVGDTIMGWTIIAIYSDRAVLQRGTETKTLRLEAK